MAADEPRFTSRFALIMSVLGIAVGTGNIWRFPRISAQNGGELGAGAFLLAWLACLATWSIPLIVAEYAMGRAGRKGVVGSFVHMAGERAASLGAFVALTATAIMFYYSVVAGWCLFYLGQSLTVQLPASTEAAMAVWESLQGGPWVVMLHATAMGLCGLAAWRGVVSIERVSKVLVPALLVIVLICVGRALMLPGAGRGLVFLFTPDWATLASPRLWLEALTQNAWDTGAGWGLILTYAAYMRRQDFVVKNAVLTGVGNNLVSLLAAVMVFATVFAILGDNMSQAEVLEVMKASGPASTGLTFIWMPQLFARMGAGGVLATLFFLGLSFAALSSLISMIELATRILVDFGMPRPRAIVLVVGGGFLLGLPSALNVEFLGNQDFVWGVALMISGLLFAVAIRKETAARVREQVLDQVPDDWRLGRGWEILISWVVPLQAVVLLGWWLWLSVTAYAPDTWFDPFDPYSVATCGLQWGVGFVGCLLGGRWMVERLRQAG